MVILTQPRLVERRLLSFPELFRAPLFQKMQKRWTLKTEGSASYTYDLGGEGSVCMYVCTYGQSYDGSISDVLVPIEQRNGPFPYIFARSTRVTISWCFRRRTVFPLSQREKGEREELQGSRKKSNFLVSNAMVQRRRQYDCRIFLRRW